jgi:DNA polymerase bacteriophage-type
MLCFSDTETFSEIPISHGSYKYSEGSMEVMIFTYAFDNGPVKVWDRTQDPKMPADLKAAIDNPEVEFVFHNGGNFDRVMIEKSLGPRILTRRIFDTMAAAYSHGFPGGLEILGDIFNVPVSKAKSKDGKKLIQLFCQPRPKNHTIRRATKQTHPLEWDRFLTYATLDIEAMRFIYHALPKWNYRGFERTLWEIDQRINERGIKIDIPFAQAAVRALKRAQDTLAEKTDDATMGLVERATQRDLLLKHILAAYGVELPDMQASTLEHRLEDPELPSEVKELISIRLQASSTSTAKYAVFLRNVSSDGRLRGALQFCGAARTKRWCLAEGSLILVKDENENILEKPIEKVLLTDKTWDGATWVSHEGVVFSGEKEVIEHDGVVATAEHRVYISPSKCVTLAEAKKHLIPIWRGHREIQNI